MKKKKNKKVKKVSIGDFIIVNSSSDEWRGIYKGDIGRVVETEISDYSPELIDIELLKTMGERTHRMHTYEVELIPNKMTFYGQYK